ncbi:MAG: hypothetical protein ACJ741_13075 [Pyrinomonadaceae bacterium]
MSTDADMTVANNYGSPVACRVSNADCMLENGDGDSHLERFNATIASGQSLSNLIATDASGSCNTVQSQFTLDFTDSGGEPIGSITLELGRGHFKTGVVSNTAPQSISAAVWGKGKKRHIWVGLVPKAEALVNSWLWANLPPMEAELKLPAVTVMGIEFEAATLTGLGNLHCTGVTVGGTAETGVTGKLKLEASELYTHGKVGIHGLPKIDGGLTLDSPKLSATATLKMTSKGMEIQLADLTLNSTTVSAKVLGVEIPSWALTLLAKALEEAINHGPVHDYLLKQINKHLPHEEKVSS